MKTSSCKAPVIFVGFLIKLEISQHICRKCLKYKISSNSVQWEPSCSVRADGEMVDMTKLIVAYRNFANAPKNVLLAGTAYFLTFWTPSYLTWYLDPTLPYLVLGPHATLPGIWTPRYLTWYSPKPAI